MKNSVVTSLPLTVSGGRSLENFAYALTPSVEGDNWTSRIAGGLPFSKEVVLDGTSAVIQIGEPHRRVEPADGVGRGVQGQTSGIAAEYGRTGGGVFNFSLKSGTNRFHGAPRRLRTSAQRQHLAERYMTDARPENAKSSRAPRTGSTSGSVSIGGPISRTGLSITAAFEDYHQSRFVLGGSARP